MKDKSIDQLTNVFNLLKASLWGTYVATATKEDFEEMKIHAVASLPAAILSKTNLDTELRNEWKKTILQQIAYNTNYKYQQERLPIIVPFTILKGTAAAKYYPHPEYRTMGDIDILTKKEDYQTACSMLLANGYKEITSEDEASFGRHRSFARNGVIVEVHAYFALLRDSNKGKILDDILINNINETHYLPDLLNGLVLLDHINQHLAGGLGLRQIIDWMMFTNRCLPDEKWPEFQALVRKVGLETLAIVTTEMCVRYLGLPAREWCANADKRLCQELMEYVLSCGNFGNKKKGEENIGIGVFAYARSLRTSFQLLQMRGLVNWQAAKKYVWLRPFAGVYQFFRYLHRGLDRDEAIFRLRKEYYSAKKKNVLLDKLKVRRVSD